MQYRQFGSTALQVSEFGFGCARLGGLLQHTTKSGTLAVLRAALDRGIRFCDTAEMYCQGGSERLLGEAFGRSRDKVAPARAATACRHSAGSPRPSSRS